MAHENSPSSVMYAELKDLGLKNRDAAAILLDTDRVFDGTSMLDRIESRSQLSRAIVHVAPGELGESLFNDFSYSTPIVLGRIVARIDTGSRAEAIASVSERFSGPAAQAMQGALAEYGLDAALYRNAVAHIANLQLQSESDRALLFLMLFVITGCTGDARKAASAVERYSSEQAGAAFRTVEAQVDLEPAQPETPTTAAPLLGLARIVGGRLKGDSLYRLATDPAGTEIGTLASADHAITDVDAGVSRRHARVFCKDGHWYVQGLKSTNGTTVISGADKVERVVEPPRSERDRTYEPEPFEIMPADTLCLGPSTRFMVIPLAAE